MYMQLFYVKIQTFIRISDDVHDTTKVEITFHVRK